MPLGQGTPKTGVEKLIRSNLAGVSLQRNRAATCLMSAGALKVLVLVQGSGASSVEHM